MFSYVKSLFIGQRRKRVALFEPDISPAIEELRNGFTDRIDSYSRGEVSFKIFNAQGSKMVLRDKMNEILEHDVDLILANGTECALLAKASTLEHELNIPILFVNVPNPHSRGLIKSYASSHSNLTGLISFEDDYTEKAAHIIQLQPLAQRILVLFQPSEHDFRRFARPEMSRILTAYGRTVHDLSLFNKQDALIQVEKAIQEFNPHMIVSLRDQAVMGAIYQIVILAERHSIPLFTCDLASISAGAAIGCGVAERDIGIEASYRACKMLFEGWEPQYMPMALYKAPYEIRLNRRAMKSQGLAIDEQGYSWFFEKGGRLS